MSQHVTFRVVSIVVPLAAVVLLSALLLRVGTPHPSTQGALPVTPAAGDAYPLDVCPVSKRPLDSMGGAVEKVIDGRIVRVCCVGCFGAFESDLEKYHAIMDALVLEATSRPAS